MSFVNQIALVCSLMSFIYLLPKKKSFVYQIATKLKNIVIYF